MQCCHGRLSIFSLSLKPAASISFTACFSVILCIFLMGTFESSFLYSIKNNCPLDFNAFFMEAIISTGKLNRWLIPIIENNPAPLYKGKVNRIRYITQVNVRPPTFAVFMSSPENLPESYARFLKSAIMDDFNLAGLPIRLMLRKGNNPYVEGST